jgi:hypothetical protein
MKRLGVTVKKPEILKMSPELEGVQLLMPMSSEDRDRLEKDIQANGVRHPIIVYRKDGTLYVLSGWHRREIARSLGLSVPVEEIEASPKERKEFCLMENLSRRHLTASQKRDIIEFLLKMDPKKSNKAIAKEAGSTKETVKAARDRLETGGEIRPLTKRKGADGKTYTTPGRKSSAGSGIIETFRKSDPKSTWSFDFSQTHESSWSDERDKKISRFASYIGFLIAKAEELKHKAENEENKTRALQLIGEARATARIADELEKVRTGGKKKR